MRSSITSLTVSDNLGLRPPQWVRTSNRGSVAVHARQVTELQGENRKSWFDCTESGGGVHAAKLTTTIK